MRYKYYNFSEERNSLLGGDDYESGSELSANLCEIEESDAEGDPEPAGGPVGQAGPVGPGGLAAPGGPGARHTDV